MPPTACATTSGRGRASSATPRPAATCRSPVTRSTSESADGRLAGRRRLGDEALRLAQHERDGPEDLGALAEDAGGDGNRAGGGDRGAAHDVAHRVEQQVAGARELAADDHLLGCEQVAGPGDGEAEGEAGVVDDALAAEIALHRERDDAAQREAVSVPPAQRLEHRLRAGECLEAAAVAAAAHGPALVDRDVADLPGGPAGALVQAPVE